MSRKKIFARYFVTKPCFTGARIKNEDFESIRNPAVGGVMGFIEMDFLIVFRRIAVKAKANTIPHTTKFQISSTK
ncbi:MAG: hypothetical protein JRI70_00325 [Deltaproteobacteria bacterium]|nr:hypothetical protein [Deltaproteobacteria bacterium]MBW2170624.1 hypothetical protein [Deltaproteobacteria bacterium]